MRSLTLNLLPYAAGGLALIGAEATQPPQLLAADDAAETRGGAPGAKKVGFFHPSVSGVASYGLRGGTLGAQGRLTQHGPFLQLDVGANLGYVGLIAQLGADGRIGSIGRSGVVLGGAVGATLNHYSGGSYVGQWVNGSLGLESRDGGVSLTVRGGPEFTPLGAQPLGRIELKVQF